MESVEPGAWASDCWHPRAFEEDVSTWASAAQLLNSSAQLPAPPGLGAASAASEALEPAGWNAAWEVGCFAEAGPSDWFAAAAAIASLQRGSGGARDDSEAYPALAQMQAQEPGSPRYVHLPSDGKAGATGADDDVAYVGLQLKGNRKRNRRPRHGKSPPARSPAKVAAEHLAQVALMSRLEATDEVWSRCAERRESDINVVKNFREYQQYEVEVPRHMRAYGDPQTPDHTDRAKSKRCWKREVGDWRAAIMYRSSSSSGDPALQQGTADKSSPSSGDPAPQQDLATEDDSVKSVRPRVLTSHGAAWLLGGVVLWGVLSRRTLRSWIYFFPRVACALQRFVA